jgi:hypothetical protein
MCIEKRIFTSFVIGFYLLRPPVKRLDMPTSPTPHYKDTLYSSVIGPTLAVLTSPSSCSSNSSSSTVVLPADAIHIHVLLRAK